MVGRLVSRLCALAACFGIAGSAVAQGTGSITGKVSDLAGSKVIAGARIQAMSGATVVVSIVTGDDGTYRMAIAPGSYTVVASRIGYAAKRAEGIRVTAGGTTTANFALEEVASRLNEVVTTASRGAAQEKVLDAPASISVVSTERLSGKPATSIAEFMKTTPGISVSQGGLVQSNIVSRGFNNAFSGSMLVLQDYRFAGVPSLRVNVPFLMSGTNEDIDRVEILNGPASALFGPNSANGVMHVITKSPFRSKGTTLTIDGGSQSVIRGAFRHANTFGDNKWGYKLSGEYFTGTDFTYNDPNEPTGVYPVGSPRAGLPTQRDFGVKRYSGEARLDYKPNDDLENVITAGMAHIGSSIELTTAFGATQVKNWEYKNFQERFRYKKFFAQVFYNDNNSGNSGPNDLTGTYYLRTGIPVVDKSNVLSAQAQQAFSWGKASFVTGVDYIATAPRSEGTIFGANEGSTDITEQGAYLQSTFPLTSKLDLVTAARGDQTNRLSGSQFSPRAALVYKYNGTNNFRFTFNRAFNSPASFSYFLDQLQTNITSAPGGYKVQAVGNPAKAGWQFARSCDASYNAGLCMHSPFVANGPTGFVAASATQTWQGLLQSLPLIINGNPAITAAQKAQLLGLLQQLGPVLGSLSPTASQIPSVYRYAGQTSTVAASALVDLQPLQASFSNTWELGYKGIIGDRLRVSVDYWYQIRPGEPPIGLVNPWVFYDGAGLGAYLGQNIAAKLIVAGVPAATAAATASAAAGALTPLMAALPLGTVAFTNTKLAGDQRLIATYQNAVGTVDVHGIDFAVDYQIGDNWLLAGTYSNLSRNVFAEIGGAINPLMSNSPKNRGSLSARYANEVSGFSTDYTVRWMDAFPVNSGLLNSLGSPPNAAGTVLYPPVPSQTMIDAGFSWRLPIEMAQKLTWSVSVTNLLDLKAATFAGTPQIGRMLLTRLKYEF
jgi:outer membrane receptor for ferrienterochelin and colicins